MRIIPIILTLVITFWAGTSFADSDTDEWQFQMTPYLWLPTIDGTLKYDLPQSSGGSPNVEIGPTDWLDLLNIGALVSGTARKGPFSLYSDVVYLSLTSKNDGRIVSVGPGSGGAIPIGADLNLDTRTDLDGLLWTFAAGYSLQSTEKTTVDAFAGVRYMGVDVSTKWNLTTAITTPMGDTVLPAAGNIGNDKDLWDGLVGIRGRTKVGNGNWSVPYYFDIGAGSSDLTWNAMLGLSYTYGWGDLVFAYRHLQYDQDSDSLLQDFSFSGPGFGATFRF